jgi:hypothetical protein
MNEYLGSSSFSRFSVNALADIEPNWIGHSDVLESLLGADVQARDL